MRHTLLKVKSVLTRFWRKPIQIDFLELSYALMEETSRIDAERLEELLLRQREMLRKNKKKHTHLDAEIQRLRTNQLARYMA